jgi:hypothetical protein
MKTYAIRSAILALIVNFAFVWTVKDALAVDTWTCTYIGSTVVCSGYQSGRYVTCTTTRMGNTTSTTCN